MSTQVRIGSTTDFPEGHARVAHANGVSIMVANVAGQYWAIANKCPHLGLPLVGGKLEGTVITCPWHNSRFDVRTGRNLDWVPGVVGIKMPTWVRRVVALGRQPHGVTSYPTVVKEGNLYVEMDGD